MAERSSIGLLTFASGHAIGSCACSFVAAFVLGWYDPKWGSPWGAVRVDLQFMPLLVGAGMIGYLLSLMALKSRMRASLTKAFIRGTIVSGLLSPVIVSFLFFVSEELLPRTAIATIIDTGAILWEVAIAMGLSLAILRREYVPDERLSNEELKPTAP